MTVYVDNMLRFATVGRLTSRWSHLLADTPAELEEMAVGLGLQPEWRQDGGTHREHYDLTEGARLRAIRAGAVPVNYPHGTARVLTRKRAIERARVEAEAQLERDFEAIRRYDQAQREGGTTS